MVCEKTSYDARNKVLRGNFKELNIHLEEPVDNDRGPSRGCPWRRDAIELPRAKWLGETASKRANPKL